MKIGRRIYYEKSTGNVVLNTGERSGDVFETTIEQDFATYTALAERIPETVGVIQLKYGEYAQDFAECSGFRVDISGDEPALLFSYPDPNEEEPHTPIYRKPLSIEIEETKQAIAELTLLLGGMMSV